MPLPESLDNIVIEGNSKTNPCSSLERIEGTVITVKYESPRTDILCARWPDYYRKQYPFLLYKLHDDNPFRNNPNVWLADYKHWDSYFRSFKPKHKDPSSGTCAIFCVVEKYAPKEIGVIGMDFLLDENGSWFHDAKAEMAAIRQVVKLIDLR